MERKNIRIGEVLLEEGLITQEMLQIALEKQKYAGRTTKLGDLLVELDYISEEQLGKALAKKLKMPYIDLSNYPVSKEVVCVISEKLAKKYNIVAIAKKDKILTVATNDPMNLIAIEEVKLDTKLQINVVLANKTAVQTIIENGYSGKSTLEVAEAVEKEYRQYTVSTIENEINKEELENAPIIKMINSIIQQGFRMMASDIHIEAGPIQTRVRMRIDGELQEQIHLNSSSHEALITRLKILGNMDIAEKRLPQDGRFEIEVDNEKIDVRLSSMPTINGEKMVLRLLNSKQYPILAKERLGFTESNMEKVNKLLKLPHGMILVTGPTGSGKSTTLYTLLNELNQTRDNIITLEDPVERHIQGINQVQMNVKAGLNFASALRAVLRQDPNIVMVGEIRDAETAQIAIRAAITGHLVFSSLHTNDAVSTIMRLVDMGIEPYLVTTAIQGIIAQRLTRCICPHCKTAHTASYEEMSILEVKEPVTIYKGEGCQHCNFTGYKGRKAVHEVLLGYQMLKELIVKGADEATLKAFVKNKEMTFLKDHMKILVLQGDTTIEEFIKITYSID